MGQLQALVSDCRGGLLPASISRRISGKLVPADATQFSCDF